MASLSDPGDARVSDDRPREGSGYVAWLDEMFARKLSNATGRARELTVGILLWPGFPMLSLTGIIEPLRHAADFGDQSRPVHCRWTVLGDGGSVTVASCGLSVAPDCPYIAPTEFDYLAVIGGLLGQLGSAPGRHRAYLRAAAAAGVPLIGVCTGVFVLAEEGLLAGRKVCVHPFHRDDFRAAFPSLRITTSEDFVADRSRITVPGGISILSLMTYLVRSHCGVERAAKVVHQLSLTHQSSVNVFERTAAAGLTHVADPRLQRAVVAIESRMCKGVAIDDIAAEAGLSARHFARLFHQQLGMTPKRFILDTRLRYARWLVENSRHSITAIAHETGFADCAHLTTSFRSRYGTTPTDCRATVQAARGLSRLKPSLARISSRT